LKEFDSVNKWVLDFEYFRNSKDQTSDYSDWNKITLIGKSEVSTHCHFVRIANYILNKLSKTFINAYMSESSSLSIYCPIMQTIQNYVKKNASTKWVSV
jgi:hypothetical protein